MIRGTEVEFRYRFWFICLIFFLAFGSYAYEHGNAAQWLLRALAHSGKAPGFAAPARAVHAIFVVASLLVGAAALVRTWGTAYLKENVVHDKVVRGEQLVADGPYRYVRNPLYFGNMLLAFGFAPMAPPIGSLILVVGMAVFVLRLIGREEAFLLERQGVAYRAYHDRVPRLWPSLRPLVPSGGTGPRWPQAWAAELWLWILFAASAVFAVTFNPVVFDYGVGGGYAVYFLIRALMNRRRRSQPA